MQKILILIFILISVFFYCSKKRVDTIYIYFDYTKERHHEKKNKIHFFKICIDNKKYVHFQYGTSKIKTVKSFNKKIMNKTNLSEFIKNDSRDKDVKYIIIQN